MTPASLTVTAHTDSFGITHRALKALRDELADRIDHRIAVWELPSLVMDHVDGYGLVIVDWITSEAVVIGDGFRGDGRGEGGAGHRAALALLSMYGVKPLKWDPVEFSPDAEWHRVAGDQGVGPLPVRGLDPLPGEAVVSARRC